MATGETTEGADLIVFDCDGVLVDSEPLAMRVLLETISEKGLTIDPASAHDLFLGRSLAGITTILRDRFSLDLDIRTLEAMRLKLYASFRRELKPVRGIAQALDALEMPFCVASSSHLERVRLSLEITGLLARFEPNIFSATMVQNGKPAPDLFLHAARQMGVRPANCVVVEDSPAGVEAARRAGMRVMGYTGASHASSTTHRDALARLEPDLIFDTMDSLPMNLASLCSTQRIT